jgi:hypothetical protein
MSHIHSKYEPQNNLTLSKATEAQHKTQNMISLQYQILQFIHQTSTASQQFSHQQYCTSWQNT